LRPQKQQTEVCDRKIFWGEEQPHIKRRNLFRTNFKAANASCDGAVNEVEPALPLNLFVIMQRLIVSISKKHLRRFFLSSLNAKQNQHQRYCGNNNYNCPYGCSRNSTCFNCFGQNICRYNVTTFGFVLYSCKLLV